MTVLVNLPDGCADDDPSAPWNDGSVWCDHCQDSIDSAADATKCPECGTPFDDGSPW